MRRPLKAGNIVQSEQLSSVKKNPENYECIQETALKIISDMTPSLTLFQKKNKTRTRTYLKQRQRLGKQCSDVLGINLTKDSLEVISSLVSHTQRSTLHWNKSQQHVKHSRLILTSLRQGSKWDQALKKRRQKPVRLKAEEEYVRASNLGRG